MEKELVIDTTGWVKIHCDKCNLDNYYGPEYAKEVMQCFGCMPLCDPPKEGDAA